MVNRWRKVVDLGLKCHEVDNVDNFVDNFLIHLFSKLYRERRCF